MSGAKISEMTLLEALPDSGAYVPVVVDEENYKFDISALPEGAGLFSDLGSLSFGAGVTRIQTSAFETPTVPELPLGSAVLELWDGAALMAEHEGKFWREDADGKVWVISQDGNPYFTPEMCGARGDFDPETYTGTDDLLAFCAVYDLINWYGGGELRLRPGAQYRLGDHSAGTTWRWDLGVDTYTMTRRDGKSITGILHGAVGARPPHFICTTGLVYRGNGATIWSDGDFHLTSADYGSTAGTLTSPIVNAQSPLQMWKCTDSLIENMTLDGGWSRQTTEGSTIGRTNGGSRVSHAMRTVACYGMTVRGVTFRDWSMDGIVTTHRYVSTLDGISLTSLEAYPEPAQTDDPDEYYPAGVAGNWVVEECRFSYCGRVGVAPVGCWGWKERNNQYDNIGRNASEAAVFVPGDPYGPGNTYQIPAVNPRYVADFEPDRNGPDQVLDIEIINPTMIDCMGVWGVAGDYMMTRVQNIFLTAAVDVSANTLQSSGAFDNFLATDVDIDTDTISILAHGLANATAVFVYTDGTLPAPIADSVTTYYVIKVDDNNIQLATSSGNASAIPPVPINLTTQGVGTHQISAATACTLPRCIDGQKPNLVRFFSTGTLPAGLVWGRDYYISKATDVAANLLGKVIRVHTTYADAVAGTNAVNITDQGTGEFYGAVYKSLPCIDRFVVNGGYLEKNPDDEVFILTGNCPITTIKNMQMKLNHPHSELAMLGLAKGGTLNINWNVIEGVRSLISSPTSKAIKSAALPGAIDTATNVITISGFSADSAAVGAGRYGYDIVYFAEAAGDYPLPLKPATPFWVTRLTADTFKVSASFEDAVAGTYVDITTTGSGTLTVYRDYEHTTNIDDNTFRVVARPLRFDYTAVDTSTNTIHCPGHGMVTKEVMHMFTTGGLPGGVASNSTNLYIIRVDADNFQVASSLSNANAGTAIDLTTQGTGTHRMVWAQLQDGSLPFSVTAYTPFKMRNNRLDLPARTHPDTGTRVIGYMRQTTELNGLTFRAPLKSGISYSLDTLNNARIREIVDNTPNRNFICATSLAGCKCINGDTWRLTTSSLNAAAVGGTGGIIAGTSTTITITTGGVSVLRSTDKLLRVEYPVALATGLIIQDAWISAAGTISIQAYNPTGGNLTLPVGVYNFVFDRSAAHP